MPQDTRNNSNELGAGGKASDFAQPRSRSMGMLTALLLVLVAFSFGWYFLFTAAPVEAPTADMTDTADVSVVDPFYVLLVGSDTRRNTVLYTGNSSEEGQVTEFADIITLVRIDPIERVITLVSVPRDTLVAPDRKINSYLAPNDASEVAYQVELLTHCSVPYYIMTTFAGYMTLVDEIGGVRMDVPQQVTVTNPADGEDVTVAKGEHLLDGAQALVFARARKEYGDNQEALRQSNVRALEIAMINQVAQKEETDLRSCLTALSENSSTNMEHVLLVWLALDYAQHRDEYTIYSGTGPYIGQMVDDNLWAVPVDLDGWDSVMTVVDAGGDPADVIEPPTVEAAIREAEAAEKAKKAKEAKEAEEAKKEKEAKKAKEAQKAKDKTSDEDKAGEDSEDEAEGAATSEAAGDDTVSGAEQAAEQAGEEQTGRE